ncbi:MAG: hypothetical protein LUC49_00690 [Prevotella sp.]|nr:hypothetical protein [Prevotella sp.]
MKKILTLILSFAATIVLAQGFSNPVIPGFHPDLFFDDGKCYFLSSEMQLSEIDPATSTLLSEPRTFWYGTDGTEFISLGYAETRFLSSETAGGFTDVYIGMFAEGPINNGSVADFDWFEYESLE